MHAAVDDPARPRTMPTGRRRDWTTATLTLQCAAPSICLRRTWAKLWAPVVTFQYLPKRTLPEGLFRALTRPLNVGILAMAQNPLVASAIDGMVNYLQYPASRGPTDSGSVIQGLPHTFCGSKRNTYSTIGYPGNRWHARYAMWSTEESPKNETRERRLSSSPLIISDVFSFLGLPRRTLASVFSS